MSTRHTLDHGEHHHLFLDLFEAGTISLTLEGTDFEARPGRVTIAIPLDVWERIRRVEVPSPTWWEFDPALAPCEGSPEPAAPGQAEERQA